MVQDTRYTHRTNFTMSIEAAEGVTTGISAADRARTIQAAVAPGAKPSDIVQPGHIFPLMAQSGGVLTRAGHTEAGCDLAQIAGLEPAAVIVEILNDDGTVSGLDYDLSQALGQQLGVKFSFNKQAWDSIIPSLQSGNHDIIMSGMNDTLERQQTLDFVDYFLGGFSILVAKGNPDGITSLKDLCGKTVAEEVEVAQIALIKAVAKECPAGQTIEII